MRGCLGVSLLLAAWGLPASVRAQGPSVGPDVIVGELHQVERWGAAGGYQAYSIGTTSCNAGDAPLSWIEGNEFHPVIAQQMYRLEDGRFEQIGLAWLKHGFLALQGSICGYPCQPTASNMLGPGCSDPYSAVLNGNQDLGPRSEVDPSTGSFPYPPLLDPPLVDLTSRRLRVATVDVDPALHPGALYWIEGQYVSPDDAAAGNHFNNASHRRVTIEPGLELAFVPGESTVRELPAIAAWAALDPEVQLTEVTVNAGRFLLGARATDLGNGFWQYEYALHNMTAGRGAGSFAVPLPLGVVAQNPGFHGIEHHSGEAQDGSDWNATVSAGAVEWSTTSHAQDPLANALRWGTLYNFRFQASAPPVPALLTIGLFEPGTPNAVVIDGLAPAGATGSTPAPTGLSCTPVDVIDIQLAWQNAGAYDAILVYRDAEQVATLPGTATGFLDAALPFGTHDYIVNAVAQGVPSPGVSCSVDVVPPAPVTGVTCTVAAAAVTIDWQNGELYDAIDVVRDGVPIATLTGTSSTYTDVGVLGGTHDYTVTASILGIPAAGAGCQVQVTPPALQFILEAPDATILYDDATGAVDFTISLTLAETGTAPASEVAGLAIALAHDPALLSAQQVTPAGPLASLHGGTGPEFFAPQLHAEGITVGTVFTLQGPGLSFPAATPVIEIEYATVPASLAGDLTGTDVALTFPDGALGTPPVDTVIAVGLDLHDPTRLAGTIALRPAGSGQFIRGDGNGDGSLDLADAVSTLTYLFNEGPAPCRAAHDANDDGGVDIGDPIAALGYLFAGGNPPPAPFPACGVDPTPDTLECDGFLPACP